MTLLALLIVILVAWSLERRERAAAHSELLASVERERKQWMDERTTLLNRIKPETAQPVLHGPVDPPPAPRPMDDDDPWLDKEHLADMAMAEELSR